MNNSIADILSTFGIDGKVQQGLSDIQRMGGESGDFAADFARTLQALRLRSGSADGLAIDGAASLTAQQLESLTALASAAPEQAATLLGTQLSDTSELAGVPGPGLPELIERAVELALRGDSAQSTEAPSPADPFAAAELLDETSDALEEAQAAGLAASGAVAANAVAANTAGSAAATRDEAADGRREISATDRVGARRAAAELALGSIEADRSGLDVAKSEAPATRLAALTTGAAGNGIGSAADADAEAGLAAESYAGGNGRWTEKNLAGNAAQPMSSGGQPAAVDVAADSIERPDASTPRDAAPGRVDTVPGTAPLSSTPLASAPGATAYSATAQLQAALGSAQWNREFGEQIVTMTLRGEQQVSLHLNPRELGPLVIEVAMVNNQAQLQFLANQQSVRAAVEQALPELREIFEDQGLSLGDTNVSDHPQPETSGREFAGNDGERASSYRADEPVPAELPLPASAALEGARGRVDLYI